MTAVRISHKSLFFKKKFLTLFYDEDQIKKLNSNAGKKDRNLLLNK
jgi:hypothetical protein